MCLFFLYLKFQEARLPFSTLLRKGLFLLFLLSGLSTTGKRQFSCITTLHFWNRYFSTNFEQTTKPFVLFFIFGTSSLLKAFANRDLDSDVEEIQNSDTESEQEEGDDGHSEQKATETGTFHFPSHPFPISE